MARFCPEWITVYRASRLKANIGECVAFFGGTMMAQMVDQWLGKMERDGDSASLLDLLRGEDSD